MSDRALEAYMMQETSGPLEPSGVPSTYCTQNSHWRALLELEEVQLTKGVGKS